MSMNAVQRGGFAVAARWTSDHFSPADQGFPLAHHRTNATASKLATTTE
jgi:hypothetical protein